jgi:hypothetical protein
LAWYEIDVNYYGILLLQKLRLASQVKTARLKPAAGEQGVPASQDAVTASMSQARTERPYEHVG